MRVSIVNKKVKSTRTTYGTVPSKVLYCTSWILDNNTWLDMSVRRPMLESVFALLFSAHNNTHKTHPSPLPWHVLYYSCLCCCRLCVLSHRSHREHLTGTGPLLTELYTGAGVKTCGQERGMVSLPLAWHSLSTHTAHSRLAPADCAAQPF
jgi:hypothetical protein